MNRCAIFLTAAFAACLLMGVSAPARAQAVRTWVSGVGDDANPCSRTAPCKTFAGAISKTAAGGEISVLDPGGFGALTITKSISIVASGVEGSVLASGTAGIVINAGVNDVVSLYGLKIEGGTTGTYGIRILQAGNVYVSNIVVRGFLASPGYGISVETAMVNPKVYLKNVEINDNVVGLYVHGGSALTAVTADNCTIVGNTMNSAKLDTSTSNLRALASTFNTSPLVLSNGAQLTSNQNNYFAAGSSAPTVSSPLQ